MAEFIADIFLCPYEACRIRLVSDPAYADSMVGCASKMMAEQGFVGAFYSGFVPILCKQIPYTMAKFAVRRPPRTLHALGSRRTRTIPRASAARSLFHRAQVRRNSTKSFRSRRWESLATPEQARVPIRRRRALSTTAPQF